MAYRQNSDPYNAGQQYRGGNTGVAPGYSANDQDPAWDSKSYQSTFAGSQAHLNPYEMTQISSRTAPPVPSYQQNYPPMQQPGGFSQVASPGWNAAREKLMKRRSVRKVELTQGNLVLDVAVPSNIIPPGQQDNEEMAKMRYTAATCDPDEFLSSRYTLRPYLLGRHTELFIVMTMYNEDEVLFVKTMNS